MKIIVSNCLRTKMINRALSHRDINLKLHKVVSIFRHGDRSPSMNFFIDDKSEENAWREKVCDANAYIASLNNKFFISKRCEDRSDVFGHLTDKGAKQLRERGFELQNRYGDDFKEHDIHISSTNYTRTQQSAQCLLDGYISNPQNRITIQVPHQSQDIANPWDANDILKNAVQEASKRDSFFHEQESKNEKTRNALIYHLPYYSKYPEKFLWVYSCDYFICRESHRLPIMQELHEHRHATLEITAKRFLRWYHDPHISNLAAGGLLKQIRSHFENPESKHRHLLYSAHDITLFPILCAIGLYEEMQHVLTFEECWPAYASLINFEYLTDDTGTYSFVRVLYNDQEVIPLTASKEFWNRKLLCS